MGGGNSMPRSDNSRANATHYHTTCWDLKWATSWLLPLLLSPQVPNFKDYWFVKIACCNIQTRKFSWVLLINHSCKCRSGSLLAMLICGGRLKPVFWFGYQWHCGWECQETFCGRKNKQSNSYLIQQIGVMDQECNFWRGGAWSANKCNLWL